MIRYPVTPEPEQQEPPCILIQSEPVPLSLNGSLTGRQQLDRLLQNDKDFEDIMAAQVGFFSEATTARIERLFRRHAQQVGVPDGGDGEPASGSGTRSRSQSGSMSEDELGSASEAQDSDESTGEETRAKGKKKSRYDPWKRFRNIQTLSIDPWIEQHLRLSGTSASKFLNDEHPLLMDESALRGPQIYDAFGACYEYTRQLERRTACDEFRWHFMMILWNDVCDLINPASTAASSRGKYGRVMTAQILKYFGDSVKHLGLEMKELNKNLNAWSTIGRKLLKLSKRLGLGCIFYLRPQLKEHFITKDMWFSGEGYKSGIAYLTSLGIKTKAEESKATELASNVRTELFYAFKSEAKIRGMRRGNSR